VHSRERAATCKLVPKSVEIRWNTKDSHRRHRATNTNSRTVGTRKIN